MSVDYSAPDIQAAIDAFASQTISWLLLGYSPLRDKLLLLSTGSDLDGCRSQLELVGEDVAYGFVREEGRSGVVTYLGEGVGGVKRARALVHGRLLSSNLLTPNGGSLTITTPADLTFTLLVTSFDEPSSTSASVPASLSTGSAPSTIRPPPVRTSSPASRPRTPEGNGSGPSTPLISATSPSPSQTTRTVYEPGSAGSQQTRFNLQPPSTAYSPAAAQTSPSPRSNGEALSPNLRSPVSPTISAPVLTTSNPITRLADLTNSSSSPRNSTSTATPSPPPTPISPSAPSPRSSATHGRPSIPLFSSLSLRKPAPGGSSSSNGNGSEGRSRLTSFGSLRDRFGSRSRTSSREASSSSQTEEGGATDGPPPALPPKDLLPNSPVALPPPADVPQPQRKRSIDGVGGMKQEWEDAYDDGYGYSISPPQKSIDGATAGIGALVLGKEIHVASSSPPAVTNGRLNGGGRQEQEGDEEEEEDEGVDPRRVSSSTFGRPGEGGLDTSNSPPLPLPSHPSLTALAATAVAPSAAVEPPMSGAPTSSVDRQVVPIAEVDQPSSSSIDQRQFTPQPLPTSSPTAPTSRKADLVMDRRRPSNTPLMPISDAHANSPTTAHWLQSREDDRRQVDDSLLPESVSARRRNGSGSSSGQGQGQGVDPWVVLDARRAERELVRVRVEAEAKERKRLKELALEKEARERVEREEERVRAARERTRVLEVERVKREERERKEREAVEEVRRQRELAAKEGSSMGGGGVEGGRLADGWLTVQAPGTVLFRRRFFHIHPHQIELYKDSSSTAKPISTIRLPKSSNVSLSDAYEETQVLHSFGIVDEEGDVWLAYLDSESDKELVVAAMTIAGR